MPHLLSILRSIIGLGWHTLCNFKDRKELVHVTLFELDAIKSWKWLMQKGDVTNIHQMYSLSMKSALPLIVILEERGEEKKKNLPSTNHLGGFKCITCLNIVCRDHFHEQESILSFFNPQSTGKKTWLCLEVLLCNFFHQCSCFKTYLKCIIFAFPSIQAKHFELPCCWLCPIQIKLPCL